MQLLTQGRSLGLSCPKYLQHPPRYALLCDLEPVACFLWPRMRKRSPQASFFPGAEGLGKGSREEGRSRAEGTPHREAKVVAWGKESAA